jgi:thioredoxin reductase
VPDDAAAALEARGVAIERREVRRVVGDGTAIEGVELADGDRIELGALFVAGTPSPNSGLAEALGCDLDPGGFVVVDGLGQTSIAGVHAAGDVTDPGRHQVSLAVAGAVSAASSCVRHLLL